MIYLSYFLIGIFLVTLQSALFSQIDAFKNFYDILLPYIIYVGLFRSIRDGLIFVIIIGFIADSISGGPLGLYTTVYFWLFLSIQWIIRYLHWGNSLILLFFVAAGVLFENLVFIGTVLLLQPEFKLPDSMSQIISNQLLWAVFTGPVILFLLKYCHTRLERWYLKTWGKRNNRLDYV